MLQNHFKIKNKVWVYPGAAGWHMVSIPIKQSRQISNTFGDLTRGFGSLKIKAYLGSSVWTTSIFPDKKTKTYILPIKAAIRKKERVIPGKYINFILEIIL